jgi:hypothetical protein
MKITMVDYVGLATIAGAAPLAFTGKAVSLHDRCAWPMVDCAREMRMRPHGVAGPDRG